MVELLEKPMAEETEEKILPIDGDDDDGPEEGEIVEESEETGSSSMGDPSKSLVAKHPLEHSWTFWFDNRSSKAKQADWGSTMRPIYTFSTIEDFWGIYNNIRRPSMLTAKADFHCFKNEIKPEWEDPVCANGGTWTVTFSRGKADTSWLYTLLAMIGEQFDYGDEICGAVVNVRAKEDKIGLWTKNATSEAVQVSIGRQWKDFLDYNDQTGFIFHEDAKMLERSAKNRYTV